MIVVIPTTTEQGMLRLVQNQNGVIRAADHVDKGYEDQAPSKGGRGVAWLPGIWIPRFSFPGVVLDRLTGIGAVSNRS